MIRTAWPTPILLSLILFVLSVTAGANDLHPEFPLLDGDGIPVLDSGKSFSTMKTCGGCHDAEYIASSSDHADAGASQLHAGDRRYPWEPGPGYFGGWDPIRYDADVLDPDGNIDAEAWLKRYGGRHTGGGPVSGLVEMNCLLCHSNVDGRTARITALAEGDFAWANSAFLSGEGIVSKTADGWQWNPDSFLPGGQLKSGLLDVHKPKDENCAQCHGQVSNHLSPPLTLKPNTESRNLTERTGQIISPQKLVDSGLNLADKESLTRPFDVHSDRVLGCVNCHYSLNNPVYFRQREESRPAHLEFDPRRMTASDYLTRPLHQFAKGQSIHGLAAVGSTNSLRRCASCHDATEVHEWLPYRERHFNSLACESCHVPMMFGPALQTVDWTMLDADGEPNRKYRGIEGDVSSVSTLITGFRPVLLPRSNDIGETRLAPFNLVTSWYWVAGDPPRPVTRSELEAALFEGPNHHHELVSGLDKDGDGSLREQELLLDDSQRLELVRKRLQSAGLGEVSLSSEITPFSINHNVVNGRWATRECATCHGGDSILAAPFALSDWLPGDMEPSGSPHASVSFTGHLDTGAGGAHFAPDASLAGFYIIGLDGLDWIDQFGALIFLAVWVGVLGHAAGRYIAKRRRAKAEPERERVYMYDVYERLWHWMQAIVILSLLFTGLVIHKPDVFGAFSFAYVVNVHNVLGFILLINAALALFYHLASGEIQQYLPEPRDFFARAIMQVMYYSRGIFRGEGHPFEKSRRKKLNPLQQITYLAILNVLLPAQVITGILIWGTQRWPDVVNSLGGLPVLAPLHTLIAWLFATFLVMHVYLTTAAGHTPAAGIQSMVTGWEELKKRQNSDQRSQS